jgi:hypothetical protein
MRRGNSDDCRRLAAALTAATVAMGLSAASHAQSAAPPPDAPVVVSPTLAPPPPPAEPPPAAESPPAVVAFAPPPVAAPRPESDFDVDQRRWAVGYAGVSLVPTGAGSITVPALGLRYWMSPSSGVDVALGIGYTGGSTESAGTSTGKSTVFGVLVQGGIPFVLSTHRHVNFELGPYLTVGYGRTSSGMMAYYPAETDYNGLRVDVGARAGFEVFFGFIGIPELALSATIGAQFEYLRTAQSMNGTDSSDTTYSLLTTVQNNPWDIFAGSVAARYYF